MYIVMRYGWLKKGILKSVQCNLIIPFQEQPEDFKC